MKNYFLRTEIHSAVLIWFTRSWMKQVVLVLTGAFLILLAVASNVRAQAQPVVPLLNFYEYNYLTYQMTVHFGYYNPNDFAVTIPIAPNKNFFSPPPPIRGQPAGSGSVPRPFLPGLHRDDFVVTFDITIEPEILWMLQNQHLSARQAFPTCQSNIPVAPSLVNFRGTWDPTATYYCSDVVSSAGGYWVAHTQTMGEVPGSGIWPWAFIGDIWLQHVLGETARGPAGPPGPAGPQGPPGPEGPEGPPGQGLHVQGDWSKGRDYATNDVVSYDGSSWVAKRNSNNIPPGDGDDWLLLARKGDNGATGDAGPQGPQGPAGASNTFPSQLYTIPKTGTIVIKDEHVNTNSIITLQYVGGDVTGLPPIETRTEDGALCVSGVPGREFRYVVIN